MTRWFAINKVEINHRALQGKEVQKKCLKKYQIQIINK
jgi:hypothetical protein